MSKREQGGSPERISEAVETLGWLADQVPLGACEGTEAQMVDTLSLARSYVLEFAIHRSLGASDSEATAATARRELNFDEHRLSESLN